jgi:hypothetical protein
MSYQEISNGWSFNDRVNRTCCWLFILCFVFAAVDIATAQPEARSMTQCHFTRQS